MPVSDRLTSTANHADLWTLALERQQIDPSDLAAAIERQIQSGDLDFRTRLLIRDSVQALAQVWDEKRLTQWMSRFSVGDRLQTIINEDLGRTGFPFLAQQLMEHTTPESVLEFLRELGLSVQHPTKMVIGGSGALILERKLSRRTQDIDVVDEIPAEIRDQHDMLDKLIQRHRLRLAHFQSHYLPSGWESRLKSLGRFGQLDVSLVDEYDITIGKFFSKREKDRDDLRALARQLDKDRLTQHLKATAGSFLAEPALRQNATDNWYIIYGEPLPA